jgi:hypothetical protein
LSLIDKLSALRADYETVTGRPFSHFYCPILFRDEPVDLCQAHIAAFHDSSRAGTVQRADVDNFVGSVFEADFVAMQHEGNSLLPA